MISAGKTPAPPPRIPEAILLRRRVRLLRLRLRLRLPNNHIGSPSLSASCSCKFARHLDLFFWIIAFVSVSAIAFRGDGFVGARGMLAFVPESRVSRLSLGQKIHVHVYVYDSSFRLLLSFRFRFRLRFASRCVSATPNRNIMEASPSSSFDALLFARPCSSTRRPSTRTPCFRTPARDHIQPEGFARDAADTPSSLPC